ncbi:hydrogenobyrinic acid a,c-diamide synthase (glutamine-hydrolysing) /cobyrinate a,c-diamide synthase [Chitinophaga sp. YR627]|uniref:cobyrinate a,c-diamide synthase n=1 Tax=Chitinophaga sp. YR627 TaxID=1881041 RepID=UPI0008E06C7A|nr:cobyrinate a,c-diamide synthase [Chitinophaga sp. YR627]SFM83525.1 hydrogenobyrinic acid a,c-diamide synthase (glutamine-hydrolysing) /cobyrinate a,c-diamide synthase [Chitinophaga sp. YR627]
MKPQFLIAAPSSNSGKTTITLGLLRLLHKRGLSVQPFKCGPDYIDTKHHSLAAHTTSVNLDTFMMSEVHLKEVYGKYAADADVVITEGVMGLFDGADRMKGSSAEIAMLLDLPVILVVNAKAMAYSVAPLIYGFMHFHPGVKIAGVIFNFVNTESHYQFLKDACADLGIAPLGYVPANEHIKIPSRHLGLAISAENDYDAIIEAAAEHISRTVDVDLILAMTQRPEPVHTPFIRVQKGGLPIAVASDEAFNFTYLENLEVLRNAGEVSFFSPLHDTEMPAAEILYLAGGYPELYLEQLSANVTMRESVRAFCEKGGKVIAECGGMMYLGESIGDKEGVEYPMVGFLGLKTTMKGAKLSLGYRIVEIGEKRFKGHEFHYSTSSETGELERIGKVYNARGKEVDMAVYRKGNVVASYMHVYWGESGEWLGAE